jgi:hypothetical protein
MLAISRLLVTLPATRTPTTMLDPEVWICDPRSRIQLEPGPKD